MNRWDEIQLLTSFIFTEHNVDLNNGTLYVHPHAYAELVKQTGYESLDAGFVMGQKFNIFLNYFKNNNTYNFRPKIGRKNYSSNELYHEMKLAKIREERNEKL